MDANNVDVRSEERLQYRWYALGAFAFHAFMNQFMYMNFAVTTELTEEHFRISPAAVNWYYTAAMLTAVPSFLLVMLCIDAYNWTVTLVATLATVSAAWIRTLAVMKHSFELGVVSSVLLGPGTGLIFTGIAEFPERFFECREEITLARGIATQMAFCGWALGGLLAPLLMTSSESMLSFCLVQAVITSLCVLLFCWAHPPKASSEIQADAESEPLRNKDGSTNWPTLILTSVACSTMQAIGFTVPAVQEAISADIGYDHVWCALFSFGFIMAGVCLGLLLASQLMTNFVGRRLVLSLFWVATVALVALQCLVRYSDPRSLISYSLLLVVIGACSLGFVNVAIPIVIDAGLPLSGKFTGGTVELLGFLTASLLVSLSPGRDFVVCVAASVCAALLMTVAFIIH